MKRSIVVFALVLLAIVLLAGAGVGVGLSRPAEERSTSEACKEQRSTSQACKAAADDDAARACCESALPDFPSFLKSRPIAAEHVHAKCWDGTRFRIPRGQSCAVCVTGRGLLPRAATLAWDRASRVTFHTREDEDFVWDPNLQLTRTCQDLARDRQGVQSLAPSCLGAGKCARDAPADLRVGRAGGLFAMRCVPGGSTCTITFGPPR
ncbi:MAG: hypothetical protein QNK03_22205 [Myxococcota bacterium]|nr:hypothetical protein [Myxococcota bacterium]